MNRFLELEARIRLQNTNGIGPLGRKRILNYYNSAVSFWNAGPKEWKEKGILGNVTIQKAQQELKKPIQVPQSTQFTLLGESAYPTYLQNCPDAPIYLFYEGKADWNSCLPIGIVGCRNPTSYGVGVLKELIQALSHYKVCTVSGLAMGIDTLVHAESIQHSIPTYGVLAHGFSTLYPPDNIGLAKKMKEAGGILTEYLPHVLPIKEYFPMRNRIVAGMVQHLIIIESSIEGGSMITAKLANSYGKDVWAVPGSIKQKESLGCNQLIGQQIAEILDSIDRYCSVLELPDIKNRNQIKTEFLSGEECEILSFLELGRKHIDRIHEQFPQYTVHPLLLNLELEGYILRSGSYYSLQ